MPEPSAIQQLFRERGVRCTPQRYAIIEFLAQSGQHAAADEIFAAINRRDSRASLATVYKSLRQLAAAGLVQEVAMEGHAARFEANLHPHHHFVCERCGGIEDVTWFEVPGLRMRAKLGSRTLSAYQVLIRGVCARCSQTGPE